MRVGIDICEVDRFLEKINDEKLINRLFTKKEKDHIFDLKTNQGIAERMSGKFCAKEAFLKLLGIGLDKGITWLDMEVLPDKNGKPNLFLNGVAKEIAEALKIKGLDLSISHTKTQAIAVCFSN